MSRERRTLPHILGIIVITSLFASPIVAQTDSGLSHSQMPSSGASIGQPSDHALIKAVRTALAGDSLTKKNSNIYVTARDRMITLSGEVKSRTAAERAQQLAAQVNGVRGIENEMSY
jgi:osmotically-inducible protein OsmY